MRVRALDVDGSPAEEAWVRIAEVDGLAIQAFDSEKTSIEGLTELATPAGLVTLEARGSKAQGSTGRVTVAVAEGQTVPADIALKPPEQAAR